MTDNTAREAAAKAAHSKQCYCTRPDHFCDFLGLADAVIDAYEQELQRQSQDNDTKAMKLLNSLFYYDKQNDVHVFAYAEQRIIVREDEYLTQLYDAIERLNTQEQS